MEDCLLISAIAQCPIDLELTSHSHQCSIDEVCVLREGDEAWQGIFVKDRDVLELIVYHRGESILGCLIKVDVLVPWLPRQEPRRAVSHIDLELSINKSERRIFYLNVNRVSAYLRVLRGMHQDSVGGGVFHLQKLPSCVRGH